MTALLPTVIRPTISIVTPSYNQGQFVERTIRSVLQQNYESLEYIVMDGGSTDDSVSKIRRYESSLKHWQSKPDGGQSSALASGFSQTSGQIMAYLNSDDCLLPGTLDYVADFFETNPDVDAIYSHRCIIDRNDKIVGHWVLPQHSNYLMERWAFIPQETCFWRRSLFERAGNIDPTFAFAMDYDLFVRYMRHGRFRRVNRFLAAFRVHEDAKTTREYATIGKAEVNRVLAGNDIRRPPLVGKLLSLLVRVQSGLYNRLHLQLAGLPPGKGFSLDSVWGTELSEVRAKN